MICQDYFFWHLIEIINLYPAIKFTVPVVGLTHPVELLAGTAKRITPPAKFITGDVIFITGDVMILTGYAILLAVPVENMPEGVMERTGHEDLFTGAERIFAAYVERTAGHDPLLTGSVNFLTDHV